MNNLFFKNTGPYDIDLILKTIDIDELVAKTEEEYINLVEKLLSDKKFRNNIKLKIKENEKDLYRNEISIRALEDFFQSAGDFLK